MRTKIQKHRVFDAAVLIDGAAGSEHAARVVPKQARFVNFGDAVAGYWSEPAKLRRAWGSNEFRSRRAREIETLVRHRHFDAPPTEAEARAISVAIASVSEPNQAAEWIRRQCFALDPSEQTDIITDAFRNPRWWKAPEMGRLLLLTKDERRRLDIRTFRAAGVSKREMTADRKQRARERMRAARAKKRAGRAPPTKMLQPWLAEGVSRRTWYRRRAAQVSGQNDRKGVGAQDRYTVGTDLRGTQSVRNITSPILRTDRVPPAPQSTSCDVAGWPPRPNFPQLANGSDVPSPTTFLAEGARAAI